MPILFLWWLGCNGCAPGDAQPTSLVGDRPDVVVVVLGGQRADHMGLYGYDRATTPKIDAWAAKDALVFDAAYSHAPWTRSSAATLLTGTLPSEHGLQVPGEPPGPGAPPLQAVMRRQGYTTAAVVSTPELRPRANPFLRGFQSYKEVVEEGEAKKGRDVSSQRVTDEALAIWTAHHAAPEAGPLLLVAYYNDANPPFGVHEGHDFGTEIADRYDSEVAWTDGQVGRLLDAVGDRALVVVTADHGVPLGERGADRKANDLHEEQLRVPLIVKLPGLLANRVDRPVGLVDVAPSVLAWVGLKVPEAFTGKAMPVSPFGKVEAPRRPIRLEVRHHGDARGVIDGRHKLIEDRATGALELYDLKADPGETTNLVDDPDARVELERLRRVIESTP